MSAPEKKQYHVVSSFHDGLPRQFYPKDLSRFPNLKKIYDDYKSRKKILYKNFEAEREAHLKGEHSQESLEFLALKHQKAEVEFDEKYRKLKEEFELQEKEIKSSLEKGLE